MTTVRRFLRWFVALYDEMQPLEALRRVFGCWF
jgi:hypothetical protein